MQKETDFVVKYTNKDIIDKIEKLDAKVDAIDKKMDTIFERTETNRKLLYAGFGFTMFVLGIIIKHTMGA